MTSEFDGVLTAWDDLALEKITALISRKAVVGEGQTLAQVYLKRGALVPLHAHDGEELIYVLEGVLGLRLAGDDVVVREGEVVRVPGRAPHQIEALADTFALAARGTTPRRTEQGGGRRPDADAAKCDG